ncbi:MAG: DUF4271 domain-containing protein [Bacteroidetes bacterium]|nr:DUF4271 domain-containing protein [Bacteroidota bacterium]MBS1741175.1 DUF4271 domain-containing protein [Bacteroidota bacterium]MBS1776063.1 DUF4271 domain-containing protein [Bacteroidota bacterium]
MQHSVRIILFIALFLFANYVQAHPSPVSYGLPMPTDSVQRLIDQRWYQTIDSAFGSNAQLNNKNVIHAINRPHFFRDQTALFYLLATLLLMLGFIRLSNAKYFQLLWAVFRSPSSSGRSLKEKLQSATVWNLLLNLFFVISLSFYGYLVIERLMPHRAGSFSSEMIFLLLFIGVSAVYLGKYLVIRFSGWAFRVENVTELYLFNVFLINKIMGIALLPLIVLLAFAQPEVAQGAMLVSGLLILFLLINRYVRSWQVFGSFFQYSRFHFFTYLCASELLPLAVLMKLLVRGLA